MSLAAAQAMRDLADCMKIEADLLPRGSAKTTMAAMARAHATAADRIEAWVGSSSGGRLPVPLEYRDGAGRKR